MTQRRRSLLYAGGFASAIAIVLGMWPVVGGRLSPEALLLAAFAVVAIGGSVLGYAGGITVAVLVLGAEYGVSLHGRSSLDLGSVFEAIGLLALVIAGGRIAEARSWSVEDRGARRARWTGSAALVGTGSLIAATTFVAVGWHGPRGVGALALGAIALVTLMAVGMNFAPGHREPRRG